MFAGKSSSSAPSNHSDSETKPLPPRPSEKMMALLHATRPVERPVHERLSPPTPKWPFHVFSTASKKANLHEDFARHGTPNQVHTGASSFSTSDSKESGCTMVHNQGAGGSFTYEFDATREQNIYEDNDNEPGQPFYMDANVTAGGAGPTLAVGIIRDKDVENNSYYSANVPAEFLILHESDRDDKSAGGIDSDSHDGNYGILHGGEQEREISSSEEKEIELRKLDQIAEELGKFL